MIFDFGPYFLSEYLNPKPLICHEPMETTQLCHNQKNVSVIGIIMLSCMEQESGMKSTSYSIH